MCCSGSLWDMFEATRGKSLSKDGQSAALNKCREPGTFGGAPRLVLCELAVVSYLRRAASQHVVDATFQWQWLESNLSPTLFNAG